VPNRIIREGILSSERVCSLGWPEEVFYRRLMSIVDDYGRFEASLTLLRAKCYPLQVDRVREADIARWLTACQKAGLIVLYQGVIGGRIKYFLSMTDFKQQERSESKYPQPDETQMIEYDEKAKSFAIKCYQMKSSAHLDVSVSEVVSVIEGEGEKPPDKFQRLWTELPNPFPKISKWTEARANAFRARLKDSFWAENYEAGLKRIAGLDFCKGINDRGWILDVDFFLKPESLAKILEGKYDNRKGLFDGKATQTSSARFEGTKGEFD
jgi:hypothetical protein